MTNDRTHAPLPSGRPAAQAPSEEDPPKGVFSRVLVGIDGTEPGFEACRQAVRLVEQGGQLDVVIAVEAGEASFAGPWAPHAAERLWHDAARASEQAAEIAGVEARIVHGRALEALLAELRRDDGTLIAVGTHGHRRVAEIVLGGVAGGLLHAAPCSVLIARPVADPATFPRRVAVGIDGSRASDGALSTAQELERRFGAELRVVVATRGKGVDLPRAHLRWPFAETIDAIPVDALVTTAADVDLLVVGSRGLHGLRALGSVSERVAHRARSSVLVVRGDGT